MNIEEIRERVADEKYLIKLHAIRHALKEGFDRKNIVETIMKGKIIEDYFDVQRCLVCGATKLTEKTMIYLHVICEYVDEEYIEFVTAYIPDDTIWEKPPFSRRR